LKWINRFLWAVVLLAIMGCIITLLDVPSGNAWWRTFIAGGLMSFVGGSAERIMKGGK